MYGTVQVLKGVCAVLSIIVCKRTELFLYFQQNGWVDKMAGVVCYGGVYEGGVLGFFDAVAAVGMAEEVDLGFDFQDGLEEVGAAEVGVSRTIQYAVGRDVGDKDVYVGRDFG